MSEKSGKEAFTFWLPSDVLECLRQRAEQETRSVTGQIVHYVKLGIERDKASLTFSKKTEVK